MRPGHGAVAGGGGKRRFRLTPPEPKEDQFHQSVADLLNIILIPGEASWTHFPSGGYFLSPAARARLYRLGLRVGWPDILICYKPGRTLWIELKTRNGRLSQGQFRKHAELAALGHPVWTCRSIEQVLATLERCGVPFRRARVSEAYLGKAAASHQSGAEGHEAQPAQSSSSAAPEALGPTEVFQRH